MKKILTIVLLAGAISLLPSLLQAQCTTIQSGLLEYSNNPNYPNHYLSGQPLQTGYDMFGYNYQARASSGYYVNAYLGRFGFPPYEGDAAAYLTANPNVLDNSWLAYIWQWRDDHVSMKWNDAWLSNKDCDGGGYLDRYYGYNSYIGSGAWLTNHQSGYYTIEGIDKPFHWTYFVKIVAAPLSATKSGTPLMWYMAGGSEIGPAIWGAFAIIQEVYNDPGLGLHGVQYHSPTNPGLGFYGNQP